MADVQTIVCPNCRQQLVWQAAMAGKKGTCPACHQLFTYPRTTEPPADIGPLLAVLREVGSPDAHKGLYPGWEEDRLSSAMTGMGASIVAPLVAAARGSDRDLRAGAVMALDMMGICPSCGGEVHVKWKTVGTYDESDGFRSWREARTCPSCGAIRERERAAWMG